MPRAIGEPGLFGQPLIPAAPNTLSKRFGYPPFSVFNAREGWWQQRKGEWLALGIQSEIGRGTSRPHNQGKDTRLGTTDAEYKGGDCWRASRNGKGLARMRGEHVVGEKQSASLRGSLNFNTTCSAYRYPNTELPTAAQSGTSIFDPVLCELVYHWFCPPAGQVVDPFAGGSVRGIVATVMGLGYWGCDLRQEQIDANDEQAARITPERRAVWVCGDAIDVLGQAPPADLVFSCPPYGDLERYSDDPHDLSTMTHAEFVTHYRLIVLRACHKLKPDRFACFCVGEYRDKRGLYHNFVGETISAFRAAGLAYYNEAVLVTAVGSLPIRVGKQFASGRKLGKTHQNVLVFVKGDAAKAAAACECFQPAPA
jgi:hypothetical protein